MARAASFDTAAAAAAYARDEAARGDGVVVKADGLAAGKGVVVASSVEVALAAIDQLAADGVERFVIEERLQGPEASVIAICDGGRAIALPAARDHKRLEDGDAGPNTGGMGAYSPLPDLSAADVDAVLASVHLPILAELARRGTPFRGFLYAGLMLTDDGPRLLECNARLGDPEAQVILPRLVLAAAGYPGSPRRGDAIAGLDDTADGALVFHAGTTQRDGAWTTDGGRVLTVVGRGPDLEAARERAEAAADAISWDGLQRRHDIGRVPQSVPA
jgi:phosphoribosylamine--glycine ligase